MVLLRFPAVSREKVDKLNTATTRGGSLQHFVDFIPTQFGKDRETALLDVKVNEQYGPAKTPVTREMLDELFDLLGIFPRTKETSIAITQIAPELQFINEKLDAAQSESVELHGLVSGRRQGAVEEIMKAISLAKHKLYLLLEASKSQ